MKHFAILLTITLLLNGCAKTATETAAEVALQQVDVVEKQIKKECPQASIDEEINTLKTSIKSQLSTCESELSRVDAEKVKWQIAFFGLLIFIVIWFGKKLV